MGYLKEFQKEIASRDFSKFMVLWEEYCTSDTAPADEMIELLQMIKNSDYARPMGGVVEMLVTLVKTLSDPDEKYAVYRLIFDLQTTNSPTLAEIATEEVQRAHSSHPKYADIVRISGLRAKDNLQGVLSAVDLLAHINKGKFVFHNGGWGVGEVMELSFLRESILVEFENTPGQKSVTFAIAMKTLIPLKETHFLARRFGNADQLEKDAKANPAEVVKMLLTDLGPKTASEIKDEMCDLVIPEAEWVKWWQQTRSRLKKDLSVETPSSLKEPFHLRGKTLSHEQEFLGQIVKKKGIKDILATCHSFSKEHPHELKEESVKKVFLEKLTEVEKRADLSLSQEIEINLMKSTLFPELPRKDFDALMSKSQSPVDLIEGMEILQYKKQALVWVREHRQNWPEIFLQALANTSASLIRDYLFKELLTEKAIIENYIEQLLQNSAVNPELYFWLFNRALIQKKGDVPHQAEFEKWWEGLLILLSRVENISSLSDLSKKIYLLITGDRFAQVRNLFKESSFDFTKEFLLLGSKCHTLEDRDQKSLKSLAGVRFPELMGPVAKMDDKDKYVIWTTEAGYIKTQERIRHIGTIETVDNAKEIEAARALGDLRENSEYKFAKERRSRLQGEMKHLSDEIGRARVITVNDVSSEMVGPGSIVEIADAQGNITMYKILGPWDADPENNVLSSQSKLAQTILGMHLGDTFLFKDEKFRIESLKTIFDI